MRFSTTVVYMGVIASWAAMPLACDSDSSHPETPDSGSIPEPDSDNCAPFSWGTGLGLGKPVANWHQSGFMDADLDGTIEQEEVEFTLDDIHCLGLQSIVLTVGDST